MAANWRQQKEERERLARERNEEERRKKEQKIKQLLLHAPTPSGKTSPSSPPLSSSSSSSLATALPSPQSTEPENADHQPPVKNDEDEHNKQHVAMAEVGGWTKPVATAQSSGPDTHRAKPSFLGQVPPPFPLSFSFAFVL
jgi:hypothetical protein